MVVPQLQRQRSQTLRAVSESSPTLNKPEIASKPQVKESKDGEDGKSSQTTEQQSRHANLLVSSGRTPLLALEL